ncbi:MAG TPA: hypothetical protein VKE70_23145, partial [Candidatus Solibacter sp.]|nr:hypothetical protein [Candidatus Solibacter sp.]
AGHRRAAARRMEAFARAAESVPAHREAACHAWGDLSLWTLMLGDRAAAAQLAQKAISLATPSTAGNAVVARFVAMPEASPAEWAARANQQFHGDGVAPLKNLALVYALLANRHFLAAQALLEPMWQNGADLIDEGLPVLLAWCYVETAKPAQAGPLLRPNPIPSQNGPGAFTAFYFPRLFYLRGEIAKQQGNQSEAAAAVRTFLELSGPDPLMWGEEKKVR